MRQRQSLEPLLALFYLKKKRDIEAHCRTLVIRSDDFAGVVLAARVGGLGPYAYACHFNELAPEHLKPSREELNALASNGVGKLQGKALKAVRKVDQIFKDRRQLAAHLFYTPTHDYWHLFYWDQRDYTGRRNHWQHGPHIHYAHDTFTREPLAEVWRKVCEPFPRFPKSLHVRFDYHHNRTRRSESKAAPE